MSTAPDEAPPQRHLSPASRFALRFIETYQTGVSHRRAGRCPFEPSCSEYGRQAYLRYGFFKATRRTIGRLRRCRPGAVPGVDLP